MNTIVLYCNGNGEEQMGVVAHPESVSLAYAELDSILPDFQSAGGVYLCTEGPDGGVIVTDAYGQKLPEHRVTVG